MAGRTTGSTTRTALLGAATRLILERGALSVTLEAVARDAGVSKGGLLDHFPSKDALVTGLLEHYAATFSAQVKALVDEQEGDTALLRAYVRATFAEDTASRELGAAVLSAALLNPSLLQRFREQLEWVAQQLEQATPYPTRAAVVRLAADGLWIGELLGVSALSESAREALEREMLALLEEREENGLSG